MRIVYIAHPVGGDPEGNLAKINEIVRDINLNEPDVLPFVPYYADVVAMDDNDPDQRARGIKNGHTLLKSMHQVKELRLYGNRLSEGMKDEVFIALFRGHLGKIDIVPIGRTMKTAYERYIKDLKIKECEKESKWLVKASNYEALMNRFRKVYWDELVDLSYGGNWLTSMIGRLHFSFKKQLYSRDK